MAPLLLSHDDQEAVKLQTSSRRIQKQVSVKPAIPRMFERKLKKKATEISSATNGAATSIGPAAEVIDTSGSSVDDAALQSTEATEHLSNATRMSSPGAGHDMMPADTAEVRIPSKEKTQTKRPRQDFGIERHGHHLPPEFYPSRPSSNAPSGDEPVTENGSSVTSPTHRGKLNGHGSINFEGDALSHPATPDARTSTTSVPLHEVSPLSGDIDSPVYSEYQGYGHAHQHSGPPPLRTSYPPMPHRTKEESPYQAVTYSYGVPPPYYNPGPIFVPSTRNGPLTPSATPSGTFPVKWPIPGERFPSNSSVASIPDDAVLQSPMHVEDRFDSLSGHRDTNGIDSAAVTEGNEVEIVQSLNSEFHHRKNRYTPLQELGRDEFKESLVMPNPIPHLLENFNDPTFSDCTLRIVHSTGRWGPLMWSLHGIAISQSPTLNALYRSVAPDYNGKRQLFLLLGDRFTSPDAFDFALRAFYGQSVDLAISSMDFALGLTAAGYVLQSPAVARYGARLASTSLGFENIKQAIAFALEAKSLVEYREACKSQPYTIHNLVQSEYSADANYILREVLSFIANRLTEDFQLDTSAPKLFFQDTSLPQSQAPPHSPTKPRLRSIKFGDFPASSEDVLKHDSQPTSSPETTIISSVLLSLSDLYLDILLESLREPVLSKLTPVLMGERKQREADFSGTDTANDVVVQNG
ncbi:hypothetical protein MMC09_003285 [Bachmanniomyces sp. S44760]|nr:hypothetical protein [Bachmanniomyces sp. S44760]